MNKINKKFILALSLIFLISFSAIAVLAAEQQELKCNLFCKISYLFTGKIPASAYVVKTITSQTTAPITGKTVLSQEQQAACPSGMVSYWNFDEGTGTTAYDAFGRNNGIFYNGPVWTTGKVGRALSFDGVDDYVQTPFINIFNGASFTVTG